MSGAQYQSLRLLILNIPAITVPTVNRDNNQHSPNENIRLGNTEKGEDNFVNFIRKIIALKMKVTYLGHSCFLIFLMEKAFNRPVYYRKRIGKKYRHFKYKM